MPPHAQPVALVTVKNVSGCDDQACVSVRQDGSLSAPKNSTMDLSWAAEGKRVFTAVSSSSTSLAAATAHGDVCFQHLHHMPVWYLMPREVSKISVNCTTLYVLSHGELYCAEGAELTRVHVCSATKPAVADVATSNSHTLALSDSGTVYAWA